MSTHLFEITSQKELEEIVKNNKGKLIIDFTSPQCPPCVMLEPVLEELVDRGYCSVAKINVLEHTEIAEKNNISATPTLAILKDSKIIKTMLGYQPVEAWIEILEKI